MTDGDRYTAAEAEARRYRYPGSDVLVNLAGLREQAALDAFERTQVARAIETLPGFDATDYAAFLQAHAHIFGTVYAWAGQERTYTTARGKATFCRAEFIRGEMEKRFALMRQDPDLLAEPSATFAAAAARHIGEINAIHPFLEGNGRMQRVLLRALAERARIDIDLEGVTQSDWYAAADQSFALQDYSALTRIIETVLRPGS